VETLNLGTHIAQGATLGLEIDTDGGLRVKLGDGLGYGDNGEIINTREAGSNITVVDDLTSDSTTDALSAKQGKVLKGLIDGVSESIPTTLSELENDEELLWSGKRNEQRCKTEINEILTRLVIGFIWTSFSLFTFMLSFVHSETNKRYWFPRILGFVFTVIGILIFAYALPPKNEYYAITTKRIIVYNKKKKKPYESYKLSELSEPLLILNKSGDGVGIIKVSQKTPVKYRDEEISMTRYERFFYSIDNVAAVYDILNNQLSEFEM
jgi:hypothetical protein